MLVESHPDTVARAAHSDCRIHLALLHGERTRMGEIRIIAAVGRIGTEILIFYSLRLKKADDDIL